MKQNQALTREETKRLLQRWRNDPVKFAKDVFGITLWSGQAEFLRACAKNKKVACRSGHKIGKTLTFSILAWWLVVVHHTARIYIITPRNTQLQNGCWREIKRLHALAAERGYPLGCEPLPLLAHSGVRFLDDHASIQGYAADGLTDAQKLAGMSGEMVAYLLDEASAISNKEIWGVCETAPEGRFYAISNPTISDPENMFYQICQKDSGWHSIHISSVDAAKENKQLSNGKYLFPGLATLDWANDHKAKKGETSWYYKVRVLGEFGADNEKQFISNAIIQEANKRWNEEEPEFGTLSIGVDPAWGLEMQNDPSGIALVRGNWAAPAVSIKGDSYEILEQVIQLLNRYRRGREEVLITFDTSNNPGARDVVRKHFKDDANITIQSIPASGSTEKEEEQLTGLVCAMKRDELWVHMGEWLIKGGAIPASDKKLNGDLAAPKWFVNRKNAFKIEAKDDVKKRIKRSTDCADALALALAPDETPQSTFIPGLNNK